MIYAHTNKPLIYSLRMCVCLPHIYAKGPSTACVQRKNLLIHTIEENPKCALHKHKRYYSLYTLRGTNICEGCVLLLILWATATHTYSHIHILNQVSRRLCDCSRISPYEQLTLAIILVCLISRRGRASIRSTRSRWQADRAYQKNGVGPAYSTNKCRFGGAYVGRCEQHTA